MYRAVYDFLLCLVALIYLPSFLWKSRKNVGIYQALQNKLGLNFPHLQKVKSDSKCVWIHAVSVGETLASLPLIEHICANVPGIRIYFSTTTVTGQEIAKKNLKKVEKIFFLPFDWSWIINKIARSINPDLLIIMEGDFWFNLASSVKNVVLVSGKISNKSTRLFNALRPLSSRFFENFSLFCVQNKAYADNFISLGIQPSKIFVTGNLKFDQPVNFVDRGAWKDKFGISAHDKVITIGSTHPGEEGLILSQLTPILEQHREVKILLFPRHPERFDEVAKFLSSTSFSYTRLSRNNPDRASARIVLVDSVGLLTNTYQISDVSIVGGSFIPKLNGHNIFEPVAAGSPVLFGPYMKTQLEFVEKISQAKVGSQVSPEELADSITTYLEVARDEIRDKCLKFAKSSQGSTLKTWELLKPFLK